jgi:hypothetical protein
MLNRSRDSLEIGVERLPTNQSVFEATVLKEGSTLGDRRTARAEQAKYERDCKNRTHRCVRLPWRGCRATLPA